MVAALAVGSQWGIAQEATSTEIKLEEVLVTAQKRTQSLQDVPISINVYNGELLERMKLDRITDLQIQEPSLSFRAGGGPNQVRLGMRGFSSLVSGLGIQSAVAVVVDGVALAMDTEYALEMADVERVEVLKGPQGTLFGGNSVGGLINVVRKSASKEFEASLDLQISDDDEQLYRAMVSGPLSDSIGARISAYYKDRDGHVKNLYAGAENAGGEESVGLVGKFNFDFSDDLSLILTADYRDFVSYTALITTVNDVPERAAAVGGEHVFADPFLINQNADPIATFEIKGISAEFDYQLNEQNSLAYILSYREMNNQTLIEVDSSPARAADPMALPVVSLRMSNLGYTPHAEGPSAVIDSEYTTHELRFHHSSEKSQWVAGLYYRDFYQRSPNDISLLAKDSFIAGSAAGLPDLGVGVGVPSTGEYIAIAIISDAVVERTEAAAFGDLTLRLGEEFEVFGGYRYHRSNLDLYNNSRQILTPAREPFFRVNGDSGEFLVNAVDQTILVEDDKSSVTWAGRLGMSWFPTESVNLYSTLSRGFVGVGADMSAAVDPASPFLDPTASVSMEVGIKSSWLNNRLSVNAALFHQDSKNIQIAVIPPGGLTARARNAGELESQGIELSTAFQINRYLSVNASLTALDTRRGGLLEKCYFEQTSEQGCNIDQDEDGVAEMQDVDGYPSVGTPDLAYSLSLRYDGDTLWKSYSLFGMMGWSWRDEIQFQLDGDPLTVQEAYGLLDGVIGITNTDETFELSLFGKNLLDDYFSADKKQLVNIAGRVAVSSGREAQRYLGLRLVKRF
nr:TonB-dependent receptor [Spongiibacter thalassae]